MLSEPWMRSSLPPSLWILSICKYDGIAQRWWESVRELQWPLLSKLMNNCLCSPWPHTQAPVCSPTGSVTQKTERRCDSWSHFSVKTICVLQVWVTGETWLKCQDASGKPGVKHGSGGTKVFRVSVVFSTLHLFFQKVSGIIFDVADRLCTKLRRSHCSDIKFCLQSNVTNLKLHIRFPKFIQNLCMYLDGSAAGQSWTPVVWPLVSPYNKNK